MASAKATDPQTWNRYAYVGNNPMVFSDPSGMQRGPASLLYRNSAESSHAGDVADNEVAAAESYYEDRLAGEYDYILVTVEPIDGALEQAQPQSAVQIPVDENDRAVLAVLLGEASTPGEGSWGPDEYGRKAYRNPTRTVTDDDVYGEMSYMIAVINNRLIDWGKSEGYKSWKDVVEKSPDFLGYDSGKEILKNLGADSMQSHRARIGLDAIKDFHDAPFGHDQARPIFHYWKGIKQPGKGGIPFITKRGNAFRIANTDFHVNMTRY